MRIWGFRLGMKIPWKRDAACPIIESFRMRSWSFRFWWTGLRLLTRVWSFQITQTGTRTMLKEAPTSLFTLQRMFLRKKTVLGFDCLSNSLKTSLQMIKRKEIKNAKDHETDMIDSSNCNGKDSRFLEIGLQRSLFPTQTICQRLFSFRDLSNTKVRIAGRWTLLGCWKETKAKTKCVHLLLVLQTGLLATFVTVLPAISLAYRRFEQNKICDCLPVCFHQTAGMQQIVCWSLTSFLLHL